MQFLKSKDLSLNEGNYLVNASGEPVANVEFVNEQIKAHYIVTLAEKCKGKVFKASEVASFSQLANEAAQECKASVATTYYDSVAEPKSKVLDELVATALAFHTVGTKNETIAKLNKLLQDYNSINKVDNFGMYFTQGVVELGRIYSIAEIKEAMTVIVECE